MRKRKFPLFLLLVALAVIGIGLYQVSSYTKVRPFSLSFFEQEAPTLGWVNAPQGIGADPLTLSLRGFDAGAGIDEVIVRIDQRNGPKELLRARFDEKPHEEQTWQMVIDAKALGLREGRATLLASAFDKSIFSNSAEISLDVPVSFVKPRVEVLTVQHNASSGGSELVFFRFVGKDMVQGGVTISGAPLGPALPASALDQAFAPYPNIYFSLFALPLVVESGTRLEVRASDLYGNTGVSPFNYRIKNNKPLQSKIELSDEFLTRKAGELSPLLGSAAGGKSDEELFRLINEELRKENEKTLAELLANHSAPCEWRKPFTRPLAAAPKSTFGEARSYVREGRVISQSMHMGIDLADVAGAKVTAAQTGKVVFAGDLGIYGSTVVIDHGCRVATLYGHLSAISVTPDSTVAQGQELGRTGATGLAGGDHLHYEVRVNGKPVSPFEWWDPAWVRDHIDNKVRQVQQSLIGTPGE